MALAIMAVPATATATPYGGGAYGGGSYNVGTTSTTPASGTGGSTSGGSSTSNSGSSGSSTTLQQQTTSNSATGTGTKPPGTIATSAAPHHSDVWLVIGVVLVLVGIGSFIWLAFRRKHQRSPGDQGTRLG